LEATNWKTRQAGSGNNAGGSGFCLGTVRRIDKAAIEKGLITKDEFMEKLSTERAVYQEMFKKVKRD